jgi:hypothetical protein
MNTSVVVFIQHILNIPARLKRIGAKSQDLRQLWKKSWIYIPGMGVNLTNSVAGRRHIEELMPQGALRMHPTERP